MKKNLEDPFWHGSLEARQRYATYDSRGHIELGVWDKLCDVLVPLETHVRKAINEEWGQ